MSYDNKVQFWLTLIGVAIFVVSVAWISKAVQKWLPPTIHNVTTEAREAGK